MDCTSSPERQVAGLAPWLPWPFCAWPWWPEPVRAERLAALRIGVALFFLADIAVTFAPFTLDYFGKDGLGSPEVFDWRFRAPRTTWSLLRGFADPTTIYLSVALFLFTTLWILGNSLARLLLVHRNPPAEDRCGVALALWTAALGWYVGGVWARMFEANKPDPLAWIIPLAGGGLALLFLALSLFLSHRDPGEGVPWISLGLAATLFFALAHIGFSFAQMESYDRDAWWMPLFRSWQLNDHLLIAAMAIWIAAVVMLLLGCCTRTAAVLTWMLSVSFDNLNPYLENAGDTIRVILLMYLMLCPCGAVWSVDAWRNKGRRPLYVHPWAIRLIFVQLIFIYFMNGLYKAWGTTWHEGTSLHYVLGDLALTRFSQTWLLLPLWVTSALTWSVLVWELAFPVLVLSKWTRGITLAFGVMFHLGIFASMELGAFVPFALCMYLPLVPWERWTSKE
jgi:hypothetical protein